MPQLIMNCSWLPLKCFWYKKLDEPRIYECLGFSTLVNHTNYVT